MNNPTFKGIRGFIGENALSRAIAKTPTVKPVSFTNRQQMSARQIK
jgi:hypothetical protein